MAKRIILAVLLAAVLLMSVLTGCSQSTPVTDSQTAPKTNTNTASQTTPTNNQAANSNSIPQPPALPE